MDISVPEAAIVITGIAAVTLIILVAVMSRSKILALLTDMEIRLGCVKDDTAALHRQINQIVEDGKG